ncbi:MAG: PAS domain S-box protein [Acidobacteria bacterium]|nr:PAS domain S-box protein [Acidobacteriota bacterium]
METIFSTQDTLLLSLIVQGVGCIFLTLLFAALYWHHPRSYFLHWTCAWACFALYLVAGAFAYWYFKHPSDSPTLGVVLAGLANIGNWLRGPLLVLGALGFLRRREARRVEYVILLLLAVWAVIGGSLIDGFEASGFHFVALVASPHLLTGAALALCSYAVFKYWHRAHLAHSAVISAGFLLFGLDQFQFTNVVLLSSRAEEIPGYAIYVSLAGTLLELIIGMGMMLSLLQDDRERQQCLERAKIETSLREAGLSAELHRIQRIAAELASARPLDHMLKEIVRVTAEACGTTMNSLLLVDPSGSELVPAASIGLPGELSQSIKRVPIGGPLAGSCGTAALRRETMVVEDMRKSPLMQPYLAMCERVGLRAVWSVPVFGRDGKVLGTFATYHREPSRPTPDQVELVQTYAHHAAVAIENAELYNRLATSEAKYRGIFEDAVVGIYQSTPEGKILAANPTLVRMLGFQSVDELLQVPVPQLFVNPGDRQEVLDELRRHQVFRTESRLRRADGSCFWVRDIARVVRDESGVVRLYEGTLTDITEQKRGEEALRQSQQQYESLMESISDVVYSLDLDGRFTYVNPAVRQLGGFEPEDLIRKHLTNFVHPEDHDAARELFVRQLQGETKLGEFRVALKTGDVRHLQSSGRAVIEQGRVLGVTGILRDVTEQRRAEERLSRIYDIATRCQGQELFDRAASTLAELLGMKNVIIGELQEEGRILRALAAYREGALEGTLCYPIKHTPCERVISERRLCVYPRFVRELFPEDSELIAQGAESYIGAPIFRSNGSVAGVVNLFDGAPKEFTETETRILQIIGQRVGDEIERLQGEAARRSLEQQLIQAVKMEAVGTLAGGIAHDFNNVLVGISGYTSLLKMQMDDDHPFYPAIMTIEQSADRAAELTKQLLGFARGGKYKVEVMNLNEVVDRVRTLISRTFDRAIRIESYQTEGMWPFEGDAGQIEQCLLNLAVNARDAMPNGGLLMIETENITLDEAYTRSHLGTRPGKYVMLSVTDSGIGMDPATRSRIFEPFFTTKEKGKGTGMGLAMVYGIVNNHGGHIDVKSELGEGTSFRIYLPASEKTEQIEQQIVKDAPLPRGIETILVVDDERVIRELSQEMLERFGYTVLTAANGEEAARLFSERGDEIALVILDMIMPGMNGEKTFERLQEINGYVRVLLSSGYSANNQVQGLLLAGAKGFIQKPYEIRQLSHAVRNILDEELIGANRESLPCMAQGD